MDRSENTDGVFDNHKPVGRVLPVNAPLIYDPARLRFRWPFLAPFQPVVRFFIKAEFNIRCRKIAANLILDEVLRLLLNPVATLLN